MGDGQKNFPWLYGRITQRKGQAADEGGIDIALRAGTTITALGDGTLVGAGPCTFHGGGSCGGDVVTVRTKVPGLGEADVYYQHIAKNVLIKNCQLGQCHGQRITRGQIIGHSLTPPGVIEVGINPPWYGVWGPKPHPGPWVDPEGYLKSLASNGGPPMLGDKPVPGTGSGTDVWGTLSDAAQKVHIAPDETVVQFLKDIDTALALTNPFDVPNEPTFNAGPFNIPDPLAYFQDVAQGFINNGAAFTVRALFLFLGIALLVVLVQAAFLSRVNEMLEPIGGIEGGVEKLGALA